MINKILSIFALISFLFSFCLAEVVCPNCGTINAFTTENNYCGFCGTKLSENKNETDTQKFQETLESQPKQFSKIEFYKKIIEQTPKQSKRNKVYLLIGLLSTIIGMGLYAYSYEKEDISNIIIHQEANIVTPNIIDNYYYPKISLKFSNLGNTSIKDISCKIIIFDSSNKVIKTDLINFSLDLLPNSEITKFFNSDTGKIEPAKIESEIFSYRYEKIYKYKDPNLGLAGISVFSLGIFFLLKSYNNNLTYDKLSYIKNNSFFSIKISQNQIFSFYTIRI